MNYVEHQTKWLKQTRLKINDKVLILMGPSDSQRDEWCGWKLGWASEMDGCVGKVGIVVAIGSAYWASTMPVIIDALEAGIGLQVDNDRHMNEPGSWFYPFFCLAPVKDDELPVWQ